MARRVKRLIKRFIFEEDNRDRIDLTSNTRLDPRANRVKLSEPYQSSGIVKTWVTNPQSVKQWLGFQAVIHHATIGGSVGGVPASVAITGAGYRLTDGTDEYWHNGASWEVNTTDWNTEEEVAAEISSFPVASQQLGIVVQLTTTNTAYTPELEELRVLWASDIEFHEDLIYRSLVRSLRNNVRPIADYYIKPGAATTTIDLDTFPLKTPYNVVGIDSVYDRTDDPNRLVDLLDSYNSGTNTITLNTTLPQDHVAVVRFIYEPEVSVTTSQDYHEVGKVPALVLDDIDFIDAAPLAANDEVVNKGDGSAVKVFAPIQGDLEVTLLALTDKGVDQQRLKAELQRYFENNPTLQSTGLDEAYTLWLIDEYDMRNVPSPADIHTGRVRFRIRDVVVYARDSVDSFGVQRFKLTGTEDYTLAGD
jgi:hypothetical protein